MNLIKNIKYYLMKNKLAIVIPAYKSNYLRETLESLVSQTCKNFVVYIGDDCSPYDIKSIINDYINLMSIVYKRFEDNLGGRDLVSQWKRCIEMSCGEEWIWLFSDDDKLGEKCVEHFYSTIDNSTSLYDIYHFNVKIIDREGDVIYKPKKFPKNINSYDFFTQKESAVLNSFVVEYVFSRDIYNKVGGFQNFDMAWGSDIATWAKMGMNKGIQTIDGDYVYWRKSEVNITPNISNDMSFKKFIINLDYILWSNKFFNNSKIRRFNVYHIYRLFFHYSRILNTRQLNYILSKAVILNLISRNTKKIFMLSLPLTRLFKYLRLE